MPRRASSAVCALLACSALLLPAGPLFAKGAAPGPAGKAPPVVAPPVVDPQAAPTGAALAEQRGAQLFRDAVAYVANGRPVVHRVTKFFADLEDVQMKSADSQHEGAMRLWLESPDTYRYELRAQRSSKTVTTKLLVGNKMWVTTAQGKQAMHKSAEGARAIAQARKDRQRLAFVAQFVTLAGLMGPTVRFVYRGKRVGSGMYKGRWLQVDRHASGGSLIRFFFAYQQDAQGRVVRATYPGVVSIPAKGAATEHFFLSNWRPLPVSRYPGRLAAYTQAGKAPAKLFLMAFPRDIRVNWK